MAPPLLEVKALSAYYGASRVLSGVDLDVGAGEAVALVGPNGAGKTTLLQSVMGMPGIARSGSVRVGGVETIGMPSNRIARVGVALVPEGRRVFGSLTVEENLRVARRRAGRRGRRRSGRRPWLPGSAAGAAGTAGPGAASGSAWPLERVWEEFPLLAEVRRSKGAWLSGGEQQLLAIARALVSEPRLLLLDEPSEGLAPRVVEALVEQLRAVQRAGVAMLLAEQHTGLVQELASRVYALDRGAVRAQGGSSTRLAG